MNLSHQLLPNILRLIFLQSLMNVSAKQEKINLHQPSQLLWSILNTSSSYMTALIFTKDKDH